MRNLQKSGVWLLLAFALGAAPLLAAVIWDESVDGDLSNIQNMPTIVTPVDASDAVIGTVGGPNPGEFFDVFTFTVPAGFQLTEINLTSYTAAGGNVTSGFNVWPGSGGDLDDFALALLSVAVGPPDAGTNLIAPIAPLAAGDYSISLREGTPGQAYELEFVIPGLPVELQTFTVE